MSLSEVQTDEGRGRAWLRRALNESELHTHLEILITNQEVTRYSTHAIPILHSLIWSLGYSMKNKRF